MTAGTSVTPVAGRASDREQTRARYPDETGFTERGDVRTYFEVYGDGEPTILFVPPWSIVHSRVWKFQIAEFARRHRVVTFDPRGNGRSDRPAGIAAYAESELAQDLLDVLDAAKVGVAVIVSLSLGAQRTLLATAAHPERVAGLVFIAPTVPMGERLQTADPGYYADFDEVPETDVGWARYNRLAWLRDYPGFLEFFFGRCFTEPHSTKQIEDGIGWGSEIDADTLILTQYAKALDAGAVLEACRVVDRPTLVIRGDADAVAGPGRGPALAEAIRGARLETIHDGGHIPNARDPIRVNLLIREFLRTLPTAT